MAELKVAKRERLGKYASFQMRKEGFIPGVLYGYEVENTPLKVPLLELIHVIHSGDRVVDLDVDGESRKVLIQDIQHGTFDHEILHIDFNAVRMDKPVHVNVELALHGEAKGAEQGAAVDQTTFEVPVTCLPLNIPEKIELDVSDLDVGDVWYRDRLPVFEGVTYDLDEETPLVSCHIQAAEEEETEEAAEGELPAEPEVIGEKEREAEDESEGS